MFGFVIVSEANQRRYSSPWCYLRKFWDLRLKV